MGNNVCYLQTVAELWGCIGVVIKLSRVKKYKITENPDMINFLTNLKSIIISLNYRYIIWIFWVLKSNINPWIF